MLKVEKLEKRYGTNCVLNGLDFQIRKGEAFALLGSNGAGKTTCIRIILGLSKASGGSVSVREGTRIGYSPETPYFPPFLSGVELMRYYARLQGQSKKEAQASAEHLLTEIGLEINETKIKHYSKGMLQRLAMAQALIGDPDFLVLDEPTAGLDALGRIEILEQIKKYRDRGKTILINSHILNDIERVCDRGIIIKRGNSVSEWDKNTDGNGCLEELFIHSMEERRVS